MTKAKFSKQTGGIYPPEIYSTFPDDAIDIPDDLYKKFQNSEISGFDVIDGVVVEKLPAPMTFSKALAALNAQFQADVLVLNNAYAMAILVDGPTEVAKQTAIRTQYEARKDAHTAAVAALKIEYGVQ